MDGIDDGPPDRFSDPYNHVQFIGWFRLPSLRHLEIWLRDIEELKEKPELDLSHLHTLILARSTIPEEGCSIFTPPHWESDESPSGTGTCVGGANVLRA